MSEYQTIPFSFEAVSRTHIGLVRQINEDAIASCVDFTEKIWNRADHDIKGSEIVFLIADGMGGTNAGEIASAITLDSVSAFFPQALEQKVDEEEDIIRLLKRSVRLSHDAIIDYADHHPESQGMGTTVVTGIIRQGRVYVVWVGDSRVYRVYHPKGENKSKIEMLTRDHSMVWDLVEQGKLSVEEARVHPHSNIITQSLGEITHQPKPDYRIVKLYRGDRILVCTDGIHGMISEPQLLKVVAGVGTISDAAEKLTQTILQAGAEDNLSFVLLEVKEGEERNINSDKPEHIETKSGGLTAYQHATYRNQSNNLSSEPHSKKRASLFDFSIWTLLIAVLILSSVLWWLRKDGHQNNQEVKVQELMSVINAIGSETDYNLRDQLRLKYSNQTDSLILALQQLKDKIEARSDTAKSPKVDVSPNKELIVEMTSQNAEEESKPTTQSQASKSPTRQDGQRYSSAAGNKDSVAQEHKSSSIIYHPTEDSAKAKEISQDSTTKNQSK